MCVKGHIALWCTWGMKSGFRNVGFFHISVSSISSALFTAGPHFYTCRNESVMRLGGKEDRALTRTVCTRTVCTRTLTSLIEYSSLFRNVFHRREIEVNSERITNSIFPQSMTPDELNINFCSTSKLFFLNPLKTKRRLLYLKTQSVPRCKHFSSRL